MRLVRIFCCINVIQQHPEALNRFCITFDVEQFDLPSEYGIILPPEEQTEVTRKGLQAVHELISSLPVTATFFVTGTYAKYDRQGISDLSQKHEIASTACGSCRVDTGFIGSGGNAMRDRYQPRNQ